MNTDQKADLDFTVVPLKAVFLLIEQMCSDCRCRAREIMAGQVPGDHLTRRGVNGSAISRIINAVSMETDIPVEQILKKCNESKFVSARRRIAVEATKRGYTLKNIGEALGQHHTTILHLLRTAKDLDKSGVS